MNIFRPDTKIKVDQLVTTGTPSASSFLAGDGSYKEVEGGIFDVVGGRLDWVSTTRIDWKFLTSNHIRLFNPTSEKWELVQVATEPTIANTALDLAGTALVPNTIYDIFAEYDSPTAFNLVASRWSYGGDGANNSSTSYATPVMTSNTAPGPVVVSITAQQTGYEAYKAFDTSDATWATGSGLPCVLKVDFGSSVVINKYQYRTRNDQWWINDSPTAWTVAGSNNDSTWTVLDTQSGISNSGQNNWMPGTSSYYSFINTKSYRYYRMNVTAVMTGITGNCAIGELKLVAASNSLAGSSSRVSAYEATVTYAIGDRVTYGGHDWVKISTAAAGTTPVAGAAWVDNGTSVSGDFAGLYRHDGVLVSDSSTTGKSRRWLGIIYTYNNSGTVNFKDDAQYGYISNLYNTKIKGYRAHNSTLSSYTFINTSLGESHGGTGSVRANIITCNTQTALTLLTAWVTADNSSQTIIPAVGQNSVAAGAFELPLYMATITGNTILGSAQRSLPILSGYNFIALLERVTGYTATLFTNYTSIDFQLSQ